MMNISSVDSLFDDDTLIYRVEWMADIPVIVEYKVLSWDGRSLQVDDGQRVQALEGLANLALFAHDKKSAAALALKALSIESSTRRRSYKDIMSRSHGLAQLLQAIDEGRSLTN